MSISMFGSMDKDIFYLKTGCAQYIYVSFYSLQDQYLFIYQAVNKYIDSTAAVYGNIEKRKQLSMKKSF